MTPRRETIIGAGVLGALALALALNAAGTGQEQSSGDGYDLRAIFQRTDGLIVGAQVRLAGVPVGRVVEQVLDERYRAHVTLRIDGPYFLPEDSSAIIETDGLLGGKYIELQPGADEDMLQPGGRIEYTQDSVVIEDMLARIVAQAKARRVGADAAAEGTGNSLVPSLLGPSLLDDDEKGG
jgi:phospholipid/cholesterol/gamma-HCH transport system substrate-binding protein